MAYTPVSLDPTTNFGKVTPITGYGAGATAVSLVGGEGALLPLPSASGAFNLTWWNASDYSDPSDDPDKEIVRVTARTSDNLTILRGQEGTVASAKNIGNKTYKMILTPTSKMITDIEDAINYVLGLVPELGTSNQLLGINAAGDAFQYRNLIQGSNITITYDANGDITFDATGGGGGSVTPIEARAYKSAVAQGIPATTSTKIVLDAETFDTGANISASRFTATVAGYYEVTGSVSWQLTIDQKYYSSIIYKNGSPNTEQGTISAGGLNSLVTSVTDVVYLDVGDYVELWAYQSDTNPINVGNTSQATFMTVSLQASSGGDVSGPVSSTNNAIARWDGATGKVVQDSAITVSDILTGDIYLQAVTNTAGYDLIVKAGDSNAANNNGGILYLEGGDPDGSGEYGDVIQYSENIVPYDPTNMLEGLAGGFNVFNAGQGGYASIRLNARSLTSNQNAYAIIAAISESASDIGTTLAFGTRKDSINDVFEHMRIDQNGVVMIGTQIAPGGPKLTVAYPGAVNGTPQDIATFRVGDDVTLGELYLGLRGNPSATAGNRYFQIAVGDDVDYRPLVLQPDATSVNGRVGINTTTPHASAVLDLGTSTARGLKLTSLTTTQRDAISAPAEGLLIFNTTTNKLNFYTGAAWEAVTSA